MSEQSATGANVGSAWHVRRLHWSLLSFAGGLVVYYVLFKLLVDPLNPTLAALEGMDYRFLWEGETPASRHAIAAADLNARYRQAVPSVLMSLSFLAALMVAFGFILPRYGRVALMLGLLVLPLGMAIGVAEQHNNPIRMAVADCRPGRAAEFCPLDQAALRAPDNAVFTSETLSHVRFLTHFNSAVSVAAIFLLGICLFFVARSARPGELDPASLLFRRRALEAVLMIAGLVLVFSVATTHGFYHLASAMMQPTIATPLAMLASAGSTYWGAIYTTVLIVAVTPAILSILHDSFSAACAALPSGSFTERREWRDKHGLAIELKDTIAVAITAFAPVLTAPSLDIIQALAGGG